MSILSVIEYRMRLRQIKLSKLILIFLLFLFAPTQPINAQETDILDFLPAILAAAIRNIQHWRFYW